MAYNMFNNNGYTYGAVPNYGAQQPYMPIQQPQPQQSADTQVQGVKFLTSDEARAYVVAPFQSVMIVDRDNSVFYIKSADAMGKSYMETYKYEKYDANAGSAPSTPIDASMFVTKQDFANIDFVTRSDLDKFEARLDELQKKIRINEILSEKKGEV